MKVTGILPTRGRRDYAQQALRCFLSQDYSNKRLVILDDSEDRSFPEGVNHPLVRYEISPERSIPQKRNMVAALAEDADVIAHFDSDDHSEPQRLSSQIHLLNESGKQVASFHSMLFYVEPSGQVFKYINDASYGIGTSLCYRKSFWAQHPFRPGDPNPNVGEDNQFVKEARQAGELVSVDAGQLMVARIHSDSTSPHDLSGTNCSFRPVTRDAIPAGFWQ